MPNEKIIITCDSGLDLSPELIKEYNIKVLPINIRLGNDEFLDTDDITPDEVLKYHQETGSLVATSAPTVEQIFHFFTRLVHMGYTVIYFCLSSGLSQTYRNAVSATEFFEKVYVVDSLNASVGGSFLVLMAAEMQKQGKSSQEIIQEMKDMTSRVKASVLVSEVKILYETGRASLLPNMIANAISVKPSLYIDNGDLKIGKMYYGKVENAVPKFMLDCFQYSSDIDRDCLLMGHTGLNDDFLESCKNEIARHIQFKNIYTIRAGSAITAHIGKDGLMLSWLTR